jgi:hypothetical protein
MWLIDLNLDFNLNTLTENVETPSVNIVTTVITHRKIHHPLQLIIHQKMVRTMDSHAQRNPGAKRRVFKGRASVASDGMIIILMYVTFSMESLTFAKDTQIYMRAFLSYEVLLHTERSEVYKSP